MSLGIMPLSIGTVQLQYEYKQGEGPLAKENSGERKLPKYCALKRRAG